MQQNQSTLALQSLQTIIDGCAQEATQVREQERGNCFELFRRAVEERDNMAWSAIQQQYQRLVINWLHKASLTPLLPEDLDDLIQTAYTKFWKSIHKEEVALQTRFAHVGALLKYLNRCVLTTYLDYNRKREQQQRLQLKLTQLAATPAVERPSFELWEETQTRLNKVQQWLQTEMTDPIEKLLIQLLYEQALKPREIVRQYPDQFPDTNAVRRVKGRVLQRARRALTKTAVSK